MSDGRSFTARCASAAAVASCLIALRLITLSAAGTFFVGNGAAALTAVGVPTTAYTDALVTPTLVRAIHITQLQQRAQ